MIEDTPEQNATGDPVQEPAVQLKPKIAKGVAKRRTKGRRAKGKRKAPTRKPRSQRPFPAAPFEELLAFARSVFEFASGQPARRISLFDHLKKSPESSDSRQQITNAGKYGLIRGSYAAEQLEMTPDGLAAVDDERPAREQARARIKLAISDIELFNRLYARFTGNKLPSRSALIDAAKEFGVPPDLGEEAVDTFIVNLRFVGLLKTLSGAERIIGEDHLLESLPSTTIAASSVRAPQEARVVNTDATTPEQIFNNTCFYITPIGDEGTESRKHSDLFLGHLIEPALEQFGLSVVRADKIDNPGIITRQVIDYILKSRIVIADLSFHNPNVFYELALRHAVRKPIVQIVRARDEIPFDVNQMRTIKIDDADIYTLLPMIDTLRSEIRTQVRRALDAPAEVETPISIYYPNLTVTLG